MVSATNFNTRNSTFRQLMGNGLTYQVPPFQRDYSWTDEEWDDLWLDIQGTVSPGGEPLHYMGYLVLQTEDERNFDVIDGQQRLTTLSLIVLALLKNLQRLIDSGIDAERNSQRLTQIRQSYIGFLDPVTLVPQLKLTLNRNNHGYYRDYLVPLATLPQRNIRASEQALRKAFEWFDRRLQDYAAKQQGDVGMALATFVETMSDRLVFTVITVTDELNAYKVFETLNARGVRLSATDLLKNYLFSVLDREEKHDYELRVFEERWEALVGRLNNESVPDFLRAHWNSRHQAVRLTELFKTIRREITSSEQVFALMRAMEEDVDTYLALTQPEYSSWPQSQKKNVELLVLFGVKQPHPLLLAARRLLDDRDFEEVLKAVVVVSFRYNVIGSMASGEQEIAYNDITDGMIGKASVPVSSIYAGLKRIYPRDPTFVEAFASKVLRTTQSRNKRVVKYILAQLERRLSGVDVDFESAAVSVEHIYPVNAQTGWEAFQQQAAETLTYRIGNMTLLEVGRNKDLGNAEYADKRPAYATSGFTITQKLAEENDEWTPSRIDARQRWMANQATTIWRIDQLS